MRIFHVLSALAIGMALGTPVMAADKSAAAAPANDRATWVTAEDYPADAEKAGQEGSTIVQFTVTDAGAIEQCGVKQSSGSPSLDYATCQLITTRAKYTPAKDKKGRPISSSVTQRIHWQLPQASAPQSAVPYHLNIPGLN